MGKKTCFKKKVGKGWKERKKMFIKKSLGGKKKFGWKKKVWEKKKHCGQKSWAELKKTNKHCANKKHIRII